jgi:hypothetical protein
MYIKTSFLDVISEVLKDSEDSSSGKELVRNLMSK